MRKVLPIRLIHLLEMRHIVQEDVNLDDALDGATRLIQDRLDVLAALRCLVADVAFDQLAVGCTGDLTGDEDCAAGDDSLGLSLICQTGHRLMDLK